MSNGLSQAEIDALLRGDSGAEQEPEPDPNAAMTQEQIEALLAGMTSEDDDDASSAAAPPPPSAEPPLDDPGAMMTQEQIEALLSANAGDSAPAPVSSIPDMPDTAGILSDMEIDAMGEIGNISMGTAATTLYTLLGHKVDITTPRVTLTTMRRISEEYPMPFVAVEVQYKAGLEGTNILFLQENDVKIITDLLMGGDGTNLPEELTEMHLSAIGEVMNQMVGSSSTSLAKLMNLSIDISPPHAYQVNLANDAALVFSDLDEIIERTSFTMEVEGFINSQIMQVMPVAFAKRLVAGLLGGGATAAAGMSDSTSAPPPPPPPPPPPVAAPPAQPFAPPPAAAAPPPYPPQPVAAPPAQPYPQQPYPPQPYPQQPYPPQQPYQPYPQYQPYPPYPPQMNQQPPQMVDVRPAQFGSFDGTGVPGEVPGENLDLLMDVPLTVSVELGKSSKYIKDILDFNVGTIVVLDKMAGELVDIVVNGKLIAKGEVVVIDDNYGARITDIVSPSKRIGPK